jgi:DNA-binding LacI/PurR family transcriptional regulator
MHQRREGLQSVADEADETVLVDDIELHSFSYGSAYDAATRYLDVIESTPDAVFTWNDTAAMAFISAFRDAGIDVPGDVSVVGYNDIPAAEYFSPPITTIRQDTHQAGRVLVAKLMRLIDGESPQSTRIRTELIQRES